MSYREIVRNNFHRHSYLLASLTDNMAVYHQPHLTFTDCGTSCDTFNIVYIKDGKEFSFEELRDAVNHYRQKDFDFCVWLDDENLCQNTQNILSAIGLSEAGSDPGMHLNLPEHQPVDFTGTIKKIVHKKQIEIFAQMLAGAWSPPDLNVVEYYQDVSETILNGTQDANFFMYYHEHQPVSVVELFLGENKTAGIYNLFTLEEFRGKGIGSNMMNFSINYLKQQGIETVILQASDDGLGIYKHLGFRESSRFYEFQLLAK